MDSLVGKGLAWSGEGKRKRRKPLSGYLVGSRSLLKSPNAYYLFQKSLTKGVISNLDLNMHLDSHVYTLLWMWFDVYHQNLFTLAKCFGETLLLLPLSQDMRMYANIFKGQAWRWTKSLSILHSIHQLMTDSPVTTIISSLKTLHVQRN